MPSTFCVFTQLSNQDGNVIDGSKFPNFYSAYKPVYTRDDVCFKYLFI